MTRALQTVWKGVHPRAAHVTVAKPICMETNVSCLVAIALQQRAIRKPKSVLLASTNPARMVTTVQHARKFVHRAAKIPSANS